MRWVCQACQNEFESETWPQACPNPNCLKPFAFNPPTLAKKIMEGRHFITHLESEKIYIYDGGVYSPHGEQVIREESQKILGEKTTTHKVNEVVEYIRRATYTPAEMFNSPPPSLICVENGILNAETGELLPHTPDLVFLSKLPVKWDPNAACPNIEKFLSEVLPDETSRKTLLEFVGYCLYRKYHIHRALMLVGGGANGKSTFIKLVQALLGKQNVANRSLQELVEDRFAAADLFGKLANLFYDLPATALQSTGTFKGLTGGDTVKGEHKFKNAFTFDNYAKLIFSANQIPRALGDLSDAFFRRWIIVSFPNTFEGDRADRNLIQKLTTPEELSGFLKLAVEHLRELLRRGDFTGTKTIEETRKEYIRRSDPVGAFLMDAVLVDQEWAIEKKCLYSTFCEYCRKEKLTPVADVTFFKRLPQYFSHLREEQARIHSPEETRVRIITGVRFNEDIVAVAQVAQVAQGRTNLIYNARVLEKLEGEEGRVVVGLKEKENPCHPCHLCQQTLEQPPTTNQKDLGITEADNLKLQQPEPQPQQPNHDPKLPKILEILSQHRGATVSKQKVAAEAGVAVEELNKYLSDPHLQKKIIDRGGFIDVLE